MVLLSVDIADTLETVQAFAQKRGLAFPILLDQKADVARTYRVRGIPASFFIDRQGVIQVQHTGPLNESLIKEYRHYIGSGSLSSIYDV